MSGIVPLLIDSNTPRDGTRILVYVPFEKDDYVNDQYSEYVSGWFTAWWECGTEYYTGKPNGNWLTGLRDTFDSAGYIESPTHWMPLPMDPV